ncbi:chromosomal replication initiator protein DnaA [bacterium]|nr:chromosomal replication initiator protein DnaA [bacterium]
MTNEELWQAVLAQIQFHLSKANFSTWFRNTKIVSKKNNEITVSVPNAFSKEWLEKKYNNLILKVLRTIDKKIRRINYIVKTKEPELKVKTKTKLSKEEEKIKTSQLKLENFKINQKTNLNPKYTFDNFIVGGFNELARAAAWAISENPGMVYNPLFIYGGVGLGKTHLLEATGNRILKRNQKANIQYIPSDRFISSIVQSIQNHTIEDFKGKLRKLDVLIVDDIQFFSGKEKTQEVFFHIFNELYEKNKQIILSSDKPPKAIPALEERLRSRFEGGMIADIGLPDIETRIAILKSKCGENNINLPQEVLEYIATNIQKNIRELEGALNRIITFERINNITPDLKTTKKLLRNLIASPSRITSWKKILQTVSDFYNLKSNTLLEKSRRKEIVKARQIAMYLAREELKESYPSIGRKFAQKDHTTVMYACKKISQQLDVDDNLVTELNLIKQRIYNILI